MVRWPVSFHNITWTKHSSNITVIPHLSVFGIFNCLTALKRFNIFLPSVMSTRWRDTQWLNMVMVWRYCFTSTARPQNTMSSSVKWRNDTGWGSNTKTIMWTTFSLLVLVTSSGQYWSGISAVIYQNQICTGPMLTIQLWQITPYLQGWV